MEAMVIFKSRQRSLGFSPKHKGCMYECRCVHVCVAKHCMDFCLCSFFNMNFKLKKKKTVIN